MNPQTRVCVGSHVRVRVYVHVSVPSFICSARRLVHAPHLAAALNEQLITQGLAGISEIKVD